ncbi:ABC transporter substrate-binding protein [Cohnella hashimotonis]|uniref:ABC transporter substrate-binding protein n=1 Tax=Cohnella hashimotonis TaxID=2826895 RepID=A0ABT6TNH4_9BACL|nr:ABC transporter substrate-binding protein [Cohnella hashimotonis]MDI4647860.1 ABC transporter substrate-binding protein [Cohnella hashimotonis]
MYRRFMLVKLLSLMAAIIFLLLGCSSSKTEKSQSPIYEESEIAIPAEQFPVYTVKKGAGENYILSLYDTKKQSFNLAYADESLTPKETIGNDLSRLIDYSNVQLYPNAEYGVGNRPIYDTSEAGDIYILQFKIRYKDKLPYMDGESVVVVYDKTGKLIRELSVQPSESIRNFKPIKLIAREKRIVLIGNTGIQILDEQGRTLDEVAIASTQAVNVELGVAQKLPSGIIIDADLISADQIVVLQEPSSGHSYISSYSPSSRNTAWSTELPGGFLSRGVSFEAHDSSIYVSSVDSILAYDANGKYRKEIIKYEQYQSGDWVLPFMNRSETLQPGSYFYNDKNELVLFLQATDETRTIRKGFLYRELSGDEKKARVAALAREAEQKEVVRVLAPFKDNNLELKAKQFEKSHPGLRVEFTFFRESDEEFNFEDYKQYVSLQIFTDKLKWDIMATQLLPFKDYLDKDLFADVATINAEKWEQEKNKFLPNILEASTVDGTLKLIPGRISLFTVLAERSAGADLPPSSYRWSDLLQRAELAKKNNPNVKAWYMGAGEDSFVNRYERISDAFESDLMSLRDRPEEQKALIEQLLDFLKRTGNANDYASPPQDKPLYIANYFTVSSFTDYLDLLGKEKVLLGPPALQQSGRHPFMIQEGYAVNKKSDKKEQALELALYLAEHAEPNNILYKDTFDQLKQNVGTSPERIEAIEGLREITDSLDTLRYIDHRLTDALFYTARQYAEGVTDLNTAVETIQNKLWLYMNE